MNRAGGLYILTRGKKRQWCGHEGDKVKEGWGDVGLSDMPLEMETFPLYSLIASRSGTERKPTQTVMAAWRSGTRRKGRKEERDEECQGEEDEKLVCQGSWIQTRCMLSMEMIVYWLTWKEMKYLFQLSLAKSINSKKFFAQSGSNGQHT